MPQQLHAGMLAISFTLRACVVDNAGEVTVCFAAGPFCDLFCKVDFAGGFGLTIASGIKLIII